MGGLTSTRTPTSRVGSIAYFLNACSAVIKAPVTGDQAPEMGDHDAPKEVITMARNR